MFVERIGDGDGEVERIGRLLALWVEFLVLVLYVEVAASCALLFESI